MTILCYHAVDPDWRSPLAVAPDAFDRQCAWLVRRRTVLPVEEAVRRLDARQRLPRGFAAVTFDDGFESVHRHALPALRRHNVPAMVFVVAETIEPHGRAVDWVDTPPAWPLATLDVDQLRELVDSGVTIGSHSYSHRVLTELGEDECVADLRRSREVLEDAIGMPVRHLAYPRGFHDERVRSAAATAGFEASFSLPEEREPVGPQAIPRVGVYPGDDERSLAVKSSRHYLALRTSRAYPAVRSAVKGSKPPTRRAG